MHPTASVLVTLGMMMLALMVGWVFAGAQWYVADKQRRPAIKAFLIAIVGVGAWLLLTGALAASGYLLRFDLTPPPFAVLFVLTLAMGVGLGSSKFGLRTAQAIPLHWLVLSQCFRLPLELVMHQAAVEGTMPNVMSFSGYNFDILTGISSLFVAWHIKRGGSIELARWWNRLGSALLTVIIMIALLASPLLRAFGNDQVNVWVAYVPFVWLPTVLVAFAIFGHIVIHRRLQIETKK
ncbi:MAG TPA: hypothetical protein VHO25_01760 [Polyangiaceae bacterium]|nr:hypothetical protein [Polyangiaceae bacterium]